jgi:hypothetical protein
VPIPAGKVFLTISDESGVGLAQDLLGVLKRLGWSMFPIGGSMAAVGATGLKIEARSGDQAAIRLKEGLSRLGLKPELEMRAVSDKEEYALMVVIGVRTDQ